MKKTKQIEHTHLKSMLSSQSDKLQEHILWEYRDKSLSNFKTILRIKKRGWDLEKNIILTSKYNTIMNYMLLTETYKILPFPKGQNKQ